jgi:ribonucleoside-diphosphate reductase alpha chain
LKGYGRANSHTLAVAPTKSTALIMGGVSEGINPDTAMVFTQRSAGGEVDRINPWLLELMKEKGVYSQKNVSEVREAMGSVQGVSWLTDEEKSWFKTAFEINQHVIIRKAAARGKYIDQWQSLNNFFRAGEDESVVNEVHKEAFLNPDILGMYYIYSMSGIQASNDKNECVACQ